MALLVILCCALVHISLAGSSVFLYHIIARSGIVIFLSCKAVSYLLYPLLGWMADVYFTRFKFVLFSFIATILGSILGIVTPVLVLQFPEHRHSLYYIGGGAIVVGLITMGLFESTAIQFGMDQMLEASSDQLSTFIHWYYWSSNLGNLVIMSISYAVVIYFHTMMCNMKLIVRKPTYLLGYQIEVVNTAILISVGLYS